MPDTTDDLRIESLRPLIPPAILMEELPVTDADTELIAEARRDVARIVTGEDDRVVVVVGPCSIHDPEAGLEYARRLKPVMDELKGDLKIVMRTYFEKPRTTVGWKGLINDPRLDGSFAINQGLRVARTFLRDVVELGLPTALEFLDPITPPLLADAARRFGSVRPAVHGRLVDGGRGRRAYDREPIAPRAARGVVDAGRIQ